MLSINLQGLGYTMSHILHCHHGTLQRGIQKQDLGGCEPSGSRQVCHYYPHPFPSFLPGLVCARAQPAAAAAAEC